MVEKVVGIQHRRGAAEAFAIAAERAGRDGRIYGVRLKREAANRHDSNAIAVHGFADVRGWFGRRRREWHIGYLPRELAAELMRDLLLRNVPVAAELWSIYRGESGFLDFNVIVLASPGHGEKVRKRRAPSPGPGAAPRSPRITRRFFRAPMGGVTPPFLARRQQTTICRLLSWSLCDA